MNFFKEIFFNFEYQELIKKIFLSENGFKYSLAGHDNSSQNFDFLNISRESRENRSSNRNSSSSSSVRTRNANIDSERPARTLKKPASSRVRTKDSSTTSSERTSKSYKSSETNSVPSDTLRRSTPSKIKRVSKRSYNPTSSTAIETNRMIRAAKPVDFEKELNKTAELEKDNNLAREKKGSLRDKYSLVNEVKSAQKNRLNGKESGSIREIIERNKRNRAEQVGRLASVKALDSEELSDYLGATTAQVEGQGIVNSQLKIVGVLIFVLITIMFVVGTFLNKNNPLIPLVYSINRPLSIKILDNKEIRVFEVKREARTLTSASNISKNLENAFISLHALNELIYQKSKAKAQEERIPIENVRIDQDYISFLIHEYKNYINSPREQLLRPNRGFFGTTYDIIMIVPNYLLNYVNNLLIGEEEEQPAGFELLNEFNLQDQPLTPDNRVDTYYLDELAASGAYDKNEFFVINNCKIFKEAGDINNPSCEYSSVNIIMTKLYTPDNSGFLAYYLNPIKDYLLTNWLKEKVSLENFFLLFFNMTYFGNYQIGLKASFTKYFEKLSPDSMDVPHSLYMIKHLYDDNKKYYPNYDITVENILDMMIANEFVPEDVRYTILEKLDEVTKSAKLPRTSFAIYLDQLFTAGYNHFPDSYDIVVKTTFSNSLQNSLTSLIVDKQKRFEIPNGSAIIMEKNKIIAGVTISLIDGKSYYQNSYPETFAYNSIKPFMYLALLNSKKDVPSQLLSAKYQNLIFSNKRVEQFVVPTINPNLTIGSSEEKLTVKELESIDEESLKNIPSGIKKSLAERLTYLENEFFSEVNQENYNQTLNRLNIKTNSADITIPNLLDGNIKINLADLARAYTMFTGDSSIVESQFIDTINGSSESQYEVKNLLSIRKTYTNLLKEIYFNTMISPSGAEYYVMIDFQNAVVFNDKYIVTLWLGDINGDKKYKDTTESLELLVKDVLNLLQ